MWPQGRGGGLQAVTTVTSHSYACQALCQPLDLNPGGYLKSGSARYSAWDRMTLPFHGVEEPHHTQPCLFLISLGPRQLGVKLVDFRTMGACGLIEVG